MNRVETSKNIFNIHLNFILFIFAIPIEKYVKNENLGFFSVIWKNFIVEITSLIEKRFTCVKSVIVNFAIIIYLS